MRYHFTSPDFATYPYNTMTYTLSLRSQIYEPLEELKKSLTHAVTYLKSCRHYCYAEWASKLVKRASSVVGRILNHRCDDQSTTLYLEQATRWLNMIATRTRELYPQISTLAVDLYERFLALFPVDTSIQLELFDCGELRSPLSPSGQVFLGVKRFLDYWLTPLFGGQTTRWSLAHRNGCRFRRMEGEQLTLNLTGKAVEKTPENVRFPHSTPHQSEQRPHTDEPLDGYEEFMITVSGSPLKVRYNAKWGSGLLGVAHMEFHSPESPAQPIPVSETGYRSHFLPRENVSSFDSPAHYAVSYCMALLCNKKQEPTFEQILQASKGVERQSLCVNTSL